MFTHNEKNPRPSGNSTEGDGNYVLAADTDTQPNVLDEWPQGRWDDYMTGYSAGYAHGIERGRQIEHNEITTIGREAARIVHRMADIPPRDQDADAERRRRIDQRFNEGKSA